MDQLLMSGLPAKLRIFIQVLSLWVVRYYMEERLRVCLNFLRHQILMALKFGGT